MSAASGMVNVLRWTGRTQTTTCSKTIATASSLQRPLSCLGAVFRGCRFPSHQSTVCVQRQLKMQEQHVIFGGRGTSLPRRGGGAARQRRAQHRTETDGQLAWLHDGFTLKRCAPQTRGRCPQEVESTDEGWRAHATVGTSLGAVSDNTHVGDRDSSRGQDNSGCRLTA